MALVLIFLAAAILTFILVFLLLKTSRKEQAMTELKTAHKLPARQEVVYSDLKENADVLISHKYKLKGKPDYIAIINGAKIPVDLKNTVMGEPYPNQVMQLTAYALILEDITNKSVPFGIIKDSNGTEHKITFTEKLKSEALKTAELIREQQKTKKVIRNHNFSPKCAGCSVINYCDQKLI